MFPLVSQVYLKCSVVWLKGCDQEKQHPFLFYLKELAYNNSLNSLKPLQDFVHTHSHTGAHAYPHTHAHTRIRTHAHKDNRIEEVLNLPLQSGTNELENRALKSTEQKKGSQHKRAIF